MQQKEAHFASPGNPAAIHFGALLKTLRYRHGVKQLQVLTHLPGWTQTTYSRLETGEMAPAFDQLAPIYAALRSAGVDLTPVDRQQYLTLARRRIEAKKTYQEHKTDREWDELRLNLSRVELDSQQHESPAPRLGRGPFRPKLLETRHLVGREDWVASVIASLHDSLPKKLVVLQGPVGIGKSSELHRIALHVLTEEPPSFKVLLCELPAVERETGAESALELFLGTLLAEVGPPDASVQVTSLETRIAFALECLEKASRSLLLLLDNAEHLLDERGQLASCWEQFLGKFLRRQHHATLVLATREWPSWFEGERVFVAERMIPPLSSDAGALLLQHLGLASVPVEHLRQVNEAVGGVPLCLEWVASLVQEPMWLDAWEEGEDLDEQEGESASEDALTQRLLGLLGDPSLFGGPIATKLGPLLERIIEKRLSPEASRVLSTLALANMPLGKPALQMVCPRPRLLKELSAASLLAAYAQRAQVLPMVASAVRSRLSPEHKCLLEEHLMDAYLRWLNEGKASDSELGSIIAELAILYLQHHRLLEAAQLLIRYGWLCFHRGHAPRLARLAADVMEHVDWHGTAENEGGGLLLHYVLSPYLGKPIDAKKRCADYQRIYTTVLEGRLAVDPITDGHVTNDLMLYALNELRFEEAQALLEACCSRLEPLQKENRELQASLLEKRAWFFGKWCDYTGEQGNLQKAKELREQTISLYRQCSLLLSTNQEASSAHRSLLKRRLARAFNNLSYHLYRAGRFEEALPFVERAIELREQGYAEVVALAVSYGQKSEILVELGRFQEALLFDDKALAEIQRCANTGHTLSQEEVWIYRVNRGRLYLRLGRVDEAEQWLREALPHIHPRRRVYRMFAEDALQEIEQWRGKAHSLQHQLDWRWVDRCRELDAFDAYWWWAHAGPFNREEQQEWGRLFTSNPDEATREQLATLIAQSRERELAAAIAERREPRLRYPALDIEEVRRRIAALLQLDAEVAQEEPNAVVRRLYREKIEEEVWFLRMIEATYEGDGERFREASQRVYPKTTQQEMDYALSRVWDIAQQGLRNPETVEVSQRLIQFMRDRLHLAQDLSFASVGIQETQQDGPTASHEPLQMVTAQAAKRFFETVLRESGYDGWQVVIDRASTTRVESGLRRLILADTPMPVEQVRYYLIHELGGHVARSMAGERSPLGLLGIGTKNYAPTEEGLAIYHERQIAKLHGQAPSDWGTLLGTLSTGLASGVATPPQTFLSLFTFLESFFLLRRLLKRQDKDVPAAQKHARKTALANCLRTFRGVPDLGQEGVCFSKDAIYLRGLWMIEGAVAHDATVLGRLAVGKVALEYLPDLQELGMIASPQPLARLAYAPDLSSYILSFETAADHAGKLA